MVGGGPMVLGGLLYLKITLTCVSQGRLWLRVVCRALGRRVRRGWHSGQLDATFPPLVLGGSLCTSLFPNVGTVQWLEIVYINGKRAERNNNQ